MMSDKDTSKVQAGPVQGKSLSAAAKRALAEAEARRAAALDTELRPREIQGRKGLEPTRYGDWEKKGLISDF